MNQVYRFITASSVSYEIEFKPTPYLFDEGSAFSHHVVELIIRIAEDSINKRPSLDRQVAPTIAAIVSSFYQIKDEAIMLYICDSSDGKQAARKRKFDDWFGYFNQVEFTKHDFPITDIKDGITYYNSVILKNSNPYLEEILAELATVFGSCNDPK